MGIIEILGIGAALAMDAFAVSICKGLGMQKINYKRALIIALFFGGFQAAMPLIGWFLGSQFKQYIDSFSHWIAFGLLLFIGGKMIIDVLRGGDDCDDCADSNFDIKELCVMAIATSIDALATGITFSTELAMSIWLAIGIIGILTFIICVGGVIIGNKFGARFKDKATLAGGIVLILIGVKLLLSGLGVINF